MTFRDEQMDRSHPRTVVAGFDTKVAELTLLRASGGLLGALNVQPGSKADVWILRTWSWS